MDVGVIVTDPQGNFVEGLSRGNFHVFDNDVEQSISDFAAVSGPATLLLVLEAGPAVYLLEGGHLSAAYALLQHLAEQDRVALATYAEQLALVLNLSADKQLVGSALDSLRFNVGFGSLNLATSLAQALSSFRVLPGKKSIVLLSTGFDTSPPDQCRLILEQLRTSGVRVFTVSLNGELRAPSPPGTPRKGQRNSPKPNDQGAYTEEQFALADALLSHIAELTGGRAFFPRDAAQFSEAYFQIADQVRHEYSLGFAPPAHDGLLHKITVHVDPGGAATLPGGSAVTPYRVTHRQAYIAPAP